MDQKMEFAMKSIDCANFGELCRDYGISRKTGYKWRGRFLSRGAAGLEELSRRPASHARELAESVVCEIVRLKQAHLAWGPRKIRELYARKHSGEAPCESSFKRILEQSGLTKPRRTRHARESGRIAAGRKAEAPNEIWTVDFKGWWHDPRGVRVEPLTVRDEFSRMILELRAVENARTETIRACFEKLFEAHGLPGAIRSDNGPPFASSRGPLGLSRLSAWWLALGIDLERSRPGRPQDNGAHERMHKDIRDELEAGRIGRDQDAFELWRREFNTERPHEALGMASPSSVYRPSEKRYTGTPDILEYGGMETRRVHEKGTVRYHGTGVRLSTALAGWDVGMAPEKEGGLVAIWFANLQPGHFDPATEAFAPMCRSPKPVPAAAAAPADSATLHQPERRDEAASPKPTPAV